MKGFIAQDGSYNAARSARQSASNDNQRAIGVVADWLQVAKNVLTGRFGNRWNTQWAQAGFLHPSIAIPANAQEQLALALRLTNFFTANPTYEVASMKVTAAQGKALRDAALETQRLLSVAEVTLEQIGVTWDKCLQHAHKRDAVADQDSWGNLE